RRRRKEASSKRVPPRICKTSDQKRPIGQVDLESKWIRLALRALFHAEPFRVGAADREIRLEQGGAGEHGRRHRDEVLLHDAIRDRQLCAVFLHERGALVVGEPKSKVAGRRQIREHLSVGRRVRNGRDPTLDARICRDELIVESLLLGGVRDRVFYIVYCTLPGLNPY